MIYNKTIQTLLDAEYGEDKPIAITNIVTYLDRLQSIINVEMSILDDEENEDSEEEILFLRPAERP